MLKVLGVLLVVWIAFSLIGAVFEFLAWAVVVGGVVFLGAAAYSALTSRSGRRAIR
ncbi:hypothetical protein ACVGVM_09095 [Pseudonocardia bannensis]|uniref:Uncharacterized protein n=1 Tax=Pseudonocardia bannensis TaxID=630973 RepID=A0A848DCG5_9PSEU|nr:hypothetical protein [Pseudonocardia bannensis]NMH90289.1 hypothetical protein [Pseudonocardia bannensis]